jgi:ATP-dependent DNA helicase RecG
MRKLDSNIRPPTAAEFALALSAGEGQFVEFKESVSDSLARELVAFANSGGGRIYVGVADDKKVKGIPISNRLLSHVQDLARNCEPPVNIQLAPFKYQGHDLLMIEVIDGDQKPHGCSAGYFLRTGPTSQKMNRRELVGLLRGVGELRFDEMLCGDFRYPADFSASAFRAFLSAAKISTSNISREDLLVNLKLARRLGKKLILNNAAILIFCQTPAPLPSAIPDHLRAVSRHTANAHSRPERFRWPDRRKRRRRDHFRATIYSRPL